MKIYGGKRYDLINVDDPYLIGKTFEKTDKKKFLVGEDIEKYGVLKIKGSGILTTRNDDHTMHEERVSHEVCLIVCEGLYSIELTGGASAEVEAKEVTGGSVSGGGVTSWNELENKPFYKEYEEILPETDLTFSTMEGLGDLTIAMFTTEKAPLDGEEYIVTFDGVEYTSILADRFLGNAVVMGGEYTSEPFAITFTEEGNGIFSINGVSSARVGIKQVKYIPLDFAFIPETPIIDLVELGLPPVTDLDVVEIDTTSKQLYEICKSIKNGNAKIRVSVSHCFYGNLGKNVGLKNISNGEVLLNAMVSSVDYDASGVINGIYLVSFVNTNILYIQVSNTGITATIHHPEYMIRLNIENIFYK